MHVSTVDPRSFLARHGINEHADELARNLTTGDELSSAARAIARSRKFQRCRKEWCCAATAQFIREMRGAR